MPLFTALSLETAEVDHPAGDLASISSMETTTASTILISLCAAVCGCSTTLPVDYIPSPVMRGSGPATVGAFRYLPAEQGAVAQDQFQEASAPVGGIHLSEPAADLIRTAVRKELVAAGFSVDQNSSPVIEGDIERLMFDYISFAQLEFYLDINFRIVRGGKVTFAYRARAHKSGSKSAAQAQDSEAVRSTISECIDDFFLAARAKRQL